jgi:NAD(P)-dependent dehydrogenase (short-subunit alcohol dehydrogenase family)
MKRARPGGAAFATGHVMRWPMLIFATALTASALTRRRTIYSFRGKVVLITGGARGFGLLMARRLAKEGAILFLVSRTAHQLERAERELRGRGSSVRTWTCDLRDADAVRSTVERVVQEAGRIDVLINNAGIIQATPWEHATLDDYEQSLQVHFWAPLIAMRAAAPHMKRQGGGRIINVSSIGGRVAIPHLSPYGVGKAALLALSDGARAELAKDRIVVTTVTPGLMRTGSHVNVDVRGQHEHEARLFTAMTATPLTAMQGERAARKVLEACRHGRAQITTGWQAKSLERLNALAPEITAVLLAAAAAWVLPGPSPQQAAGAKRRTRDLEVWPFGPLEASSLARRNNEL